MTRDLKIRFFKRKRVYLILTLALFINILDFSTSKVFPPIWNKTPLVSSLTQNILLNSSKISSLIFFFLAYPLAALPMSDCLVEDEESGARDQLILKKGRKKYIRETYRANFILAGLSLILPLIPNILIRMTKMPAWKLNYINAGLPNSTRFGPLLIKSPLLFFALTLFISFLGGGLIGSFAMFLNTRFKSRYLGLLGVLIVDLALSLVTDLLYFFGLGLVIPSMQNVITPTSFSNPLLGIFYLLFFALLPLTYFYRLSKKEDLL